MSHVMKAPPELSVVVPVHNEAESLPVLWGEMVESLAGLGLIAEVIFVDDGSTDSSAEVLRSFVDRDRRVRLLRFETRAGLTAAFVAGLKAARGAIVATMDSDLQNDPRDLEILLAHLNGADAAIGSRQIRHDAWLKRLSSRIANAIRNYVTGDRVADSACSLRVMRRECIAALPPYDGMHRFIPTLIRLAGYRVVEVPIRHRPRRFGRSKFSVRNRAARALVDLLVVVWMMRRRLRFRIVEDLGGESNQADDAHEAAE